MNKTLHRLLSRIFKMPEIKVPEYQTMVIQKIVIELSNRQKLEWWIETPEGDEPSCPWRDFYKWYFGRPQSKSYVQHLRNGNRMITRDSIYSFETRVVKEQRIKNG
jgi:hypothetical protein